MSDPRLPAPPDPSAGESPADGMEPEMPPPPAELSAAQVTGFLRSLRNIRHFTDDPVPEEIVQDLLEVARWSGSARNIQPWEFLVITDRAVLDQMADAEGYAKHLKGAPLGILLIMHGNEKHYAQETFDEGRLSERIMLAAKSHGLGSGIGWYRPDGQRAVKELLGIPEEKLVRTVLSVGYPDWVAHKARPNKPDAARKLLAEVVHHGRYGA